LFNSNELELGENKWNQNFDISVEAAAAQFSCRPPAGSNENFSIAADEM
jgi:hypothetical protein